MKKIYALLFLFFAIHANAQDLRTLADSAATYKAISKLPQDTASADTSKWKKGGIASLTFSQSSFSDWAAGGENSLNLQSLVSVFANRMTKKSKWENNLDLGYGMQKVGRDPVRKSEDKIELNSKYGIVATPKTDYAALFNFKSQFANGYTYTDTSETFVSSFMSPSFTTLAIGLDHRPVDGLSIFISPLTGKLTTVFDDSLAAQGAFGVDTGKNYRIELGASMSIKYQKNFAENILLKSKLDLFASYEDLQAIDVNWENVLAFQLTKILTATLTTNLIYDQDILIPKDATENGVTIVENKPRVQFKQVFALGLTYKF